MNQTITITTPLYYVNDKPHLGSTYTTLACDTYARFHRLEGKTVKFITGVDEHGLKIQRTASNNNITPLEHCNKYSSIYKMLWQDWDISNDRFIRTTSSNHNILVNQFFQRVQDSGDILLGKQRGWYCVGCEEYKDISSENKEPCCPIHLKPLEWRDEENLFFALSKYQTKIEELVADPNFIQPKSRRNEIVNFVSNGLKDFSISRKNVTWGLPVPGHQGHTFYVWFDALLGYLSALFEEDHDTNLDLLEEYGWPASVHMIGKDILRFHAVYWPAMLLSAGLATPKKVFGHGFLTREGQKMGKSLGNVLDPKELLTKYGRDAISWYLLSDIHFGQDGDFQIKRFRDIVNNDLANTIGNLLNRSVSMSRKWFNNSTPSDFQNIKLTNPLYTRSIETISICRKAYEELDFSRVSSAVLTLATEANTYLNDCQPWKLIKEEDNLQTVAFHLYNVLETTRLVGLLLLPIIPETSSKILKQLGYQNAPKLWKDELVWGKLKLCNSLPSPNPIVLKIED